MCDVCVVWVMCGCGLFLCVRGVCVLGVRVLCVGVCVWFVCVVV